LGLGGSQPHPKPDANTSHSNFRSGLKGVRKGGFRKNRRMEPPNAPTQLQTQKQKPTLSCPECGSTSLYKDGLRYLKDGTTIQRWLCRNCAYRFSDPNKTRKQKLNPLDMFQHASKIQTLILNPPSAFIYNCQGSREAKSRAPTGQSKLVQTLAEVETRTEKRAAGATLKPNESILKGKIIEYLWYLKKQGYATSTVETYVRILKILHKRGANLFDPESVKKVIAQQENWSKGRKWNVVKAYTLFLKMQGLTWEKPRYKPVTKLPFIPTEKEIDELIAGSCRQIATFLQVLKETGARRGEAFNLRWKDIDLINRTIRITPEKGSEPRIFHISEKLAAMLGRLPKKSEKVWIYKTARNLEREFRRQRKKVANKLGTPRILQIHCHTLRHWKATIEYAKTKDILYVQKLLGHKSLKTTLLYTQLIALPQNKEYICKAAENVDEAKDLIEAGFEYVTDLNGVKLFRKLKTSYLGSPVHP